MPVKGCGDSSRRPASKSKPHSFMTWRPSASCFSFEDGASGAITSTPESLCVARIFCSSSGSHDFTSAKTRSSVSRVMPHSNRSNSAS
ncbi:hypothetical protein ABL78_8487 [Leptomonas seymouri]|uniref:Uncharacterized protein n=1 Tax=Leptomonas seymouri TaxID=5684 RepID=A0A0N1HSL7_LEPSE|nr:hypothetical protein ABL78_8487 [Leptomonas seymouri]|eukprot:KPI82503.1 hypothetical protein ABL78_8487 [Leptomonas seymouri]